MRSTEHHGRRLFRTEYQAWWSFLGVNLVLSLMTALLRDLAWRASGQGLGFITVYLGTFAIVIVNFAIWVSVRRMGARWHGLILGWIAICAATLLFFGAASPLDWALWSDIPAALPR